MRRWFLPLVLALLLPNLATAQTSDRDYLTALLEDNLSGAGRQVVITGFEGALSSRARMAKMTMADDAGIWITLTDVALDWQRSDLLLGRITVNSLTAAEIDLARLPNPSTEIAPEAPAFALPELPVAIRIGTISAKTLRLGAPVLGEAVSASATASLSLDNGEGQGQLQIQRLDAGAPKGQADVAVSFANATRQLDIDLQIAEGQGGLLARAMGLQGNPALEFSVQGQGPLDDFAAQIALRRDAKQQLGGQLRLLGQKPADGGQEMGAGGTQFTLDLAGDLTGLVQPAYRPFFGQQTALRAQGSTRAAGGFDLDQMTLTSQAMQLSGSLSVGAAGQPERFDLQGTLQDASGAPLILPLGLDSPAAIAKADLTARFDATKGEAWVAALRVDGWDQPDLRLSRAELRADGTLRAGAYTADLTLNAEGVQPARAATSRALGSVIWGNGRLEWLPGQGPLTLSQFTLGGSDYQITLDGALDGLAQGLVFSGQIGAQAQDLGRFAGILGHPLAGAGDISFDGRAVLLTGAFDGLMQANTRDLALGYAATDAIFAGDTALRLNASRAEKGIEIRNFTLQAQGAAFDVSGRIAGQDTALSGRFDLRDMPLGQRGFGGAVSGDLALTGPLANAVLTLRARSTGLDLGIASLRHVLAAQTDLTATVALIDLSPALRALSLSSAQITASIAQDAQGDPYRITAALNDLALISPQFPGVLGLTGTAQLQGMDAVLDLDVTGPAGLTTRIAGVAGLGQGNDLRLVGRADAGLINAFIAPRSISGPAQFDLALRGAPNLAALSGEITLQGGQLADPALPFALRDVVAKAQLGAGQITLSASAQSTSGGGVQIDGALGSTAPYPADLGITLRKLGLRNPDLFDTTVSGSLRFAGPLAAGAKVTGTLNLGRTEVQLRPTPLPAASALPGLRHTGDTAAIATTRARAGRGQVAVAQSDAPPIALDITVRATNRVYVRGRGLDVELGGSVGLQGTTANVRPAGAFDLVQGRFEILAKRLTLEEVRLEMQGQLIPYLFVRATNTRGDVTTTVLIDGPAIDPDFHFSASPEMPEEEVLAQLLFDQNLQRLSPLQGVQLAGAIASLAGRGNGTLARARKLLKLDDLDIQTTTSGETALKMGKYASEKVYTEFSLESAGKQGLDFTYTLNEKIKLRAGAETTGNTSLGIEFETNF